MLSKFTKASLHALPQSLNYTARPSVTNLRSITVPPRQITTVMNSKDPLDLIFTNDSRSDEYIRNLYKYMTTASIIGVSSALLASTAVPFGIYSAGLALTGLGLDRLGVEYIHRTKANIYTHRDEDGSIQFNTQNSTSRKLAFISSCLGYGCIVGALASMVPITSSVLGMSTVTCLFSTLGQLTYSKFTKKEDSKPTQVFLSGLFAGVVGLNLVGSFSSILMIGSPVIMANAEINTYIGLLLYNAFTGRKSQKAIENVQIGKDDHLNHASKFPENWLYALAPHFLTKFF